MIGSRQLRSFSWLAVTLVALALNSCFLLPREDEILAPPLAQPPQITYRTHAVARGDLQDTIRAFGSFVSASQSDLFFEHRGGRLKAVHVTVGDTVEAGTLVAELYTDDIEAQMAQAELSLQRAELALRRTVEQLNDRFNLEMARIDRDLAILRLEEPNTALAREQELAEVAGGAEETVRSLRQRIAEQEIAVRRAELAVERIEEGENPVSLRLAEVDVEAAQLRLAQLREQLDATKLHAPISGIVTWLSRAAQEGDNIQAFQHILRLADPTDLIFEYQGRDANKFEVGMETIITIRDVGYRGSVILTPRSVPFDQLEQYRDTVRIRVHGTIPDLRVGTSAVAQLVLAERENVLVLPTRAVQRYATRRYVHVLADGVRVERDVEVGLETATEVEIVRGLDEGEEVVLR